MGVRLEEREVDDEDVCLARLEARYVEEVDVVLCQAHHGLVVCTIWRLTDVYP